MFRSILQISLSMLRSFIICQAARENAEAASAVLNEVENKLSKQSIAADDDAKDEKKQHSAH